MNVTRLKGFFLFLLVSIATLTGHPVGTSLAKNITQMSHDEMVEHYEECKENLKNDPCAICRGMQAISVADTFSCAPVEISVRYPYAFRCTTPPYLPQEPPIESEGKVIFTLRHLGCLETTYFDVDKKEVQAYWITAFNPGVPPPVTVESATARFRIWGGRSWKYASVQNVEDVIITIDDDEYFTAACEEMGQTYFISPGIPKIRFRYENVIPVGWKLYAPEEYIIISSMAPYNKRTPNPCAGFEKGIQEGEFRAVLSLLEQTPWIAEDAEVEVVISFMPTPGLSVTPAEAYQATGPDKEGKFTPPEKSFTLTNKGNQPLDYFVSANQNWIHLRNAKGRLGAGQSVEVLAILDADILNKMDEGTKTGQVDFRNLTDSKENTFRAVTVEKVERWRVRIDGWDTLYFGDMLLSGGVKAKWRVQAEFEIVDGKYRNGQGRAGFLAPEVHSNPPGVYDCQFYKGTYLDSKGNVNSTPFIAREAFPVPGQALGSSVKMEFPGNLYYLDFFCIMDTDRAKEAFGAQKYSAFTPEERERMSRKIVEQKNARPLPSGSLVLPLKDGWGKSEGRTESFDAHTITIEQLE